MRDQCNYHCVRSAGYYISNVREGQRGSLGGKVSSRVKTLLETPSSVPVT